MITANQCIQGTLAPYQPSANSPWNRKRVIHLYNRMCSGATPQQVEWALGRSPSEVIDKIFSDASQFPLPTKNDFPWAENSEYDPDDDRYQIMRFLNQKFVKGMMDEGFKHKLVLFWSNHFVTESSVYGRHTTYLFQYYFVLHLHALGNFKDFVKDMGLTPAMLWYLNGDVNTKQRPNENYARELLELFTMGDGNYTQSDIEEVARALTGWKTRYYDRNQQKTIYVPTKYGEYRFDKDDHDYGEKTFLGVTYIPDDDDDGFNDYNKLHDIIFSQRADETARFICEKLYRFFVYNELSEEIIDGMVSTFISSGWNIETVLKQLFKSEHFFNEQAMGTTIKSHVDWYISIPRSLNLEQDVDYFFYDYRVNAGGNHVPANSRGRYLLGRIFDRARTQGQELLSPVNVAGWPGYRTWINETALVNRWNYLRSMMNIDLPYEETKEKYRQFLKDISGNSNDPVVVTKAMIDHYIIAGLPAHEIELCVIVFKEPVPSNYFDDGSWNLEFDEAPMQYLCLINYLITLPEFQLL